MKNLPYINILKGLAIFCVVYGHLIPRSSLLAKCIYSFHMPLFFVISGFLFNFEEYQHNISRFFKHKTVRLLFPYFVSIFLFFLYWLIFQCPKPFINTPAQSVFDMLLDYALHALYGSGIANTLPSLSWAGHVGQLWFLVALFCTNCMFLFSLKWLHNKPFWGSCLFFGSLSALGFWVGKYIFLPWSFDISLAAMIFVFFGFCIKKYNLLEKMDLFKYKWLAILLLLGVWFMGVHYSDLSMNDRFYRNPALAYVTAIIMSFVLFFICFKIQNVNLMKLPLLTQGVSFYPNRYPVRPKSS